MIEKHTVEVTSTLTVELDSSIIDEIMSDEWRRHFYTFATRDDTIAWIAWVCNEFGGPDHVDGLYGYEIKTNELDTEFNLVI